jgi:orotidine-5'-phosphate decarboxylase
MTESVAVTVTGRGPIVVALDAPDLTTACGWAKATAPYVSVLKIGLETFLRDGHEGVYAIRADADLPVFLDLKLHDIPNTVAGAARSVADLAPAFLTVHAAGGAAMIRAAVAELPATRVTGVTVLTSMSAADLESIGMTGTPADVVRRLAGLAVAAGARALVCSPKEVGLVRAEVGPDITLITPGIRPAGGDVGDQARLGTPEQALADGADLLVIGRPITSAQDPASAARDLAGLVAAAESTR